MLVQEKITIFRTTFFGWTDKKGSLKFEDSFSTFVILSHQEVWQDSHSPFESWPTQNNEDINYKCIFTWEKQLFCSVPTSQIHTTLTQYDPRGDPCSHLLNVCWFVLCQIPAPWTSLQRPGAPQVPFQSMHSRGRWLPGAWTVPEGTAQTTGKPGALSAQSKVPPSHVKAHRAAKAIRSWEVWRHFNSLCSQQLCQWQGKPLQVQRDHEQLHRNGSVAQCSPQIYFKEQ